MITIAPSAAGKLRELMEQTGAAEAYLRLFVTQGGCEGFSYGMAFDTELREDDTVFEQHGIRVVVDPLTLRLMRGACIEYRHTPMGEGFAVHNPRAVATCGCGHSFKVAEEEGRVESCSEAEPV